MADQTIKFTTNVSLRASGGTMSARILSTDTALASITEDPDVPGRYTGTLADHATGDYELIVTWSAYPTLPAATWWVRLEADAGTYPAVERWELPIATIDAKLTTERLAKIDGAMQAAGEGFTGETLSDQITAIEGGGGGDATEAKQDLILTKLNAARVSVVSNVSRGGTITIYLGDDDVGGNAILLPVDDEGEVLKDLLQGEDIEQVLLGAGTGDNYNEILGTITPANITAADGITTIPIEILSTDKTGQPSDSYEYHIKTIDTAGKEKVRIDGCLTLRPERRKIVS